MRSRTPPRFAAWLSDRLIVGPNRESLLGDLAEAHQRGRSAVWYWRQVIVAIVLTSMTAAGRNRASIVRWVIVLPFALLLAALTQILIQEFEWMLLRSVARPAYSLEFLWALRSANAVILGCVFVLAATRVVATGKTIAAVLAFVIAFSWGARFAFLSLSDPPRFVWGWVSALGFCIGAASGLILFWFRRRGIPTIPFRFRLRGWQKLWLLASGVWAVYLAVALLQTWSDFRMQTVTSLIALWLLPATMAYGVVWAIIRTTTRVDLRRALTRWRSHV